MVEALEESRDVTAFDIARDEPNINIPWDQVKRDLSWS
ncbi:unnamed protein product [Acidithrix sp. C25]|nr:unnamed protein product [Acidithrix sp. C25]